MYIVDHLVHDKLNKIEMCCHSACLVNLSQLTFPYLANILLT